jgi:hypothetical protein
MWMALFFWLLDTTIINAFILSMEVFKGTKIPFLVDHRRFRVRLAWNLVLEGARQINPQWVEVLSTEKNPKPRGRSCPGATPTGNNAWSRAHGYVSKNYELPSIRKMPGKHQIVRLSDRSCRYCVFCRFCIKRADEPEVAKVLEKMPKKGKKRQTAFGCSVCKVALCKEFCMRAFHEELPTY